MQLVIDAHLIAGYFREDVLGLDSAYTGAMRGIIGALGGADIAYVDDRDQIEAEYRGLVDRDWFDAWFGDRLALGEIVSVSADACRDLVRKLVQDFGFPAGSRDRRYICVASALAQGKGRPVLLSEDVDFYDPKAKRRNAKERRRLILSHGGPVARHLRKAEGIDVRCVRGHLDRWQALS